MPFLKVYIHFVWTTKSRYPFLSNRNLRVKVWKHIKEYALQQNIFVDHINGYTDHCHCLISFNNTSTIEKVIHLLKGESSHWINDQKLCASEFAWQNDYYGQSVSPLGLKETRNYIRNQETHHEKNTFLDEECEQNYILDDD